MRKFSSHIVVLLLLFLLGCEFETGEVQCYPQRVKTLISTGAGAESITADYKYEGKLIDRIIWSNKQTHYFSYDAQNQLTKVEEYDIQYLLMTAYDLTYDGLQLSRIDKYISRLDYLLHEPLDTAYLGYQVFVHKGAEISNEEVYEREDEAQEFYLKYTREYTYDESGNLTSMVSMDAVESDTAEAYIYSYDFEKNPYGALKLYFNGESFINNVLQRENLLNDEIYTYQIIYTPNQYPEQINVKQEGTLYQVITFDYTCE